MRGEFSARPKAVSAARFTTLRIAQRKSLSSGKAAFESRKAGVSYLLLKNCSARTVPAYEAIAAISGDPRDSALLAEFERSQYVYLLAEAFLDSLDERALPRRLFTATSSAKLFQPLA